MMDVKKLFFSFKNAFNGLTIAFKEEQNLRIHFVIALLVLIAAIFFQVRIWEVIVLIFTILFVIVLELINTIFEKLTDMLKPRLHAYVKTIKDIMAAAVLISALAAVVIGILIFLPYLSNVLK